MPVMVPVSDVIGLSRQVTVLAYQLLLVVAALAIAAAIAVHL